MSSATIPTSKKLLKELRRFARNAGLPWPANVRGRPYARDPRQYVVLLLWGRYYGWSFRVLEAQTDLIGPRVPKSSLHDAFARLQAGYLDNLLALCRWRGTNWIIDSTGIETDRLSDRKSSDGLFHHEHWKLHALACWDPVGRKIWFFACKATPGNVSDYVPASDLLKVVDRGRFFADRGYDSKALIGQCYEQGIEPQIKQRRCSEQWRGVRGRALKSFNVDAYRRVRGRIEAAFGGLKHRYNSSVRERLAPMREKAILCLAFSHNLRTLLRANTFTETIYRTVSVANGR